MLNKVFASAMFFLMLCVLVAATFTTAAEFLSLPAHQKKGVNLNIKEVDNKLQYLYTADKIMPLVTNSSLKELEGDLLLRKSILSSPAGDECLVQAAIAYHDSIKAAPARADLWAKLALSKAMLYQFDAEFYDALHRAFKYGGWEFESNDTIIRIGLNNSQLLNVESLLLTKESLQRLYVANPNYVIDLARTMDQLHLTCIWVADLTPVSAACLKEL